MAIASLADVLALTDAELVDLCGYYRSLAEIPVQQLKAAHVAHETSLRGIETEPNIRDAMWGEYVAKVRAGVQALIDAPRGDRFATEARRQVLARAQAREAR